MAADMRSLITKVSITNIAAKGENYLRENEEGAIQDV
jgi:hypothetical protein